MMPYCDQWLAASYQRNVLSLLIHRENNL